MLKGIVNDNAIRCLLKLTVNTFTEGRPALRRMIVCACCVVAVFVDLVPADIRRSACGITQLSSFICVMLALDL